LQVLPEQDDWIVRYETESKENPQVTAVLCVLEKLGQNPYVLIMDCTIRLIGTWILRGSDTDVINVNHAPEFLRVVLQLYNRMNFVCSVIGNFGGEARDRQ